MKKLNKIALYLLIIIGCFACKEPTVKEPQKQATQTAETTKQTQALLLTQPFEYDPSDKDKVTGDYVAQTKITIPPNLATQSKWIMFEGPVLENDVIAYRFYADTRHRFDIYGKRVPDLVMDTVSWNYHDIMDWGSDVLKVGNSLGMASPAIWFQDSLYTLSDSETKTIEVLENGNQQSMLRTTFGNLKIGNSTFDLIQDWSIKAGDSHSTIHLEIKNGQLPEGAYFATGIVKHLDDLKTGQTKESFYGYTWGKQSFHKENMGMAIFAAQKYQPEVIANELTHTYIFKNASKMVDYSFLAAWERGNSQVKTDEAFEKLIIGACK